MSAVPNRGIGRVLRWHDEAMPGRTIAWRWVAGGAVLVGALLGGCSSGQGAAIDTGNPYAAEFTQALADASSDFERGVLADGVITPEELQEAQRREVSCLTDHGITAHYRTDSNGSVVLDVQGYSGDEPDQGVMSECSRGTTGQILGLYDAIRVNPNHEDMNDLVAACLRRHGLAPADFTGRDLQAIWDTLPVYTGDSVTDSSAELDDSPLMIPGGGDLRSEEGLRCQDSPRS
jgi:hypothetical protein